MKLRVLGVLLVGILAAGAAGAWAALPAWITYRHDGARSGFDPDSASPVTPVQAWQTPGLDAAIYAQPLVYGSRVYVATENDTVYALDSGTGAIVWHRHLATPVNASALGCGNIDPTVGITSTPVIDPATGRIYVVGDTWDGSNKTSVAHDMWALNLSDGSVAVGPVGVDPPGSSPIDQLQRASLALDAGKVLIGYGANAGDCGTYNGWLVAEREDGSSMQTFEVDAQEPGSGGAIWASGNAPPVDGNGNIWLSSGNGDSASFGYQESVIKLDTNLGMLDHWTPSDWSSLDASDTDIGSSMPVLLPGGLVFQIGKAGTGYLLNGSNLPVGAYSSSVCNGSWGGGIYVSGVLYVACANGMHAESIDAATGTFAPLSGWTVNGSAIAAPTLAGGLVWSADYNNGTLYGLDPRSGATRFSTNLTGFEHFTSPSAGGGKLFVANNDPVSGNDQITAFTIANPPAASPTMTSISSSYNPARPGAPVTFAATVSPAPDDGTVTFIENGAAIPGCSTHLTPAAAAPRCTVSFPSAGSHTIIARYLGDTYYAGSSAALIEYVSASAPPPVGAAPSLSQLHIAVVHRRLRVSLVLSEMATVRLVVSRLVPGRMVGGRCRTAAKHGHPCRRPVPKLRRSLAGRSGTNRFRPQMVLTPGHYAVTVTAIDAANRRSEDRTVIVNVPRRQH